MEFKCGMSRRKSNKWSYERTAQLRLFCDTMCFGLFDLLFLSTLFQILSTLSLVIWYFSSTVLLYILLFWVWINVRAAHQNKTLIFTLNLAFYGRRPRIFFLMEDDLKYFFKLKMTSDIFVKGIRPQILL